jgi:hypothetical protein
MNRFLLTALLVLCFGSLYAQNRAGIKGVIIDSISHKPMEMVTVGVTDLKDSSFVSYTSTTKTGIFSLTNMPAGRPLVIIASSIGFSNVLKVVTLVKGQTVDVGTLLMKASVKMLGEVGVTAHRQAIVVNKDTIEFDAAAFKVRPNGVVEELLKKLPGVQVDNDGSIKVNGRPISKLTIDGKEFFGNDPRIASKNLDASLVAKVQIYDDRENDPDHLVEDSKVSKIINIKFKKAFKKSIFGKVYAGGGSRQRFESGGLFNMFRDTLQLSVIGVGNNLNKTGFSSNDLSQLGGFNRSGDEATYNGSVPLGGQSNGGIEKILSGGFNLNQDYGEKLKLNLVYFYSKSKVKSNYSSLNQQFFTADTLFTTNNYTANNIDNKHNVTGLVRWKPDTCTTFNYVPKLSFTTGNAWADGTANRYNRLAPLNQSYNMVTYAGSHMQFQHNFSYYHKFRKKDESLNITHSLNIDPERNNSFNNLDLTSQTTTLKSETLRRLNNNDNRSTSASLDVSYRSPITKNLIGTATLAGSYGYNSRVLQTFDLNLQTGVYNIFQDSQSADLNRSQYTETAKAGLTYKFNKHISLDASLAAELLQINNRFNKNVPDLNQRYLNLLPWVRVQLGDLSINYSSSVAQPSVYNLQPITVQTTQLYAFTGNPYLKPSRNQDFGISFNKYYSKSDLFIYTYANASFENNSVTTLTQLTTEGISRNTPVNRNGRYNINLNIGLSKKFKTSKTWQIRMNPYLGFSRYRSFFILNQSEGFQLNTFYSINQNLNINWKDVIELSPTYSIRPQLNSYTGVSFQNIKYIAQSSSNRFTVRWPKRVYWEGTYDYTYNPLTSPGFQKHVNMLNASIAVQMFKKDQGEIKLSCYDILNQNISAYRYAGTNSITDSQNQILKRYFLLTYMIKFNKTSTK